MADDPNSSELVNMASQFRGLPMSDLIGGPLKAASDAQVQLAKATADFIQTIGFVQPLDQDGKPTGEAKARTANFSFSRPNKDGTGSEDVSLTVPMLAIVKVPSLAIDTVDITFDMEVKSSFSHKDSEDSQAKLSADLKMNWGIFSATVHIEGSVASHKENTRSSDNSAKYHVQVHAEDKGMPEGLARVLDMMNSAIVPQITTTPSPTPPQT